MAITKERKEELAAEYTRELATSSGMILAHYNRLTVQQMQALRHRVAEAGGKVYVVKNTLLRHALEAQGLKPPADLLTGPTLAAFCHKDAPAVAKVFRDYVKEVEEGLFTLRGAMVEGQFMPAEAISALADMPSREVLLAQVLGTINAPASQVVGVIASGVRQVLNVLQAYVDKLEKGGAEAAA